MSETVTVVRRPIEASMSEARRILSARFPNLVFMGVELRAVVDTDEDGDGKLDPNPDTGPGERPGYYSLQTIARSPSTGGLVVLELLNEVHVDPADVSGEAIADLVETRALPAFGLLEEARPVPISPADLLAASASRSAASD
ncbi:MAG: hypothetical protein ACF8XB_12595 [Planctomycetota bacterium JB042]